MKHPFAIAGRLLTALSKSNVWFLNLLMSSSCSRFWQKARWGRQMQGGHRLRPLTSQTPSLIEQGRRGMSGTPLLSTPLDGRLADGEAWWYFPHFTANFDEIIDLRVLPAKSGISPTMKVGARLSLSNTEGDHLVSKNHSYSRYHSNGLLNMNDIGDTTHARPQGGTFHKSVN